MTLDPLANTADPSSSLWSLDPSLIGLRQRGGRELLDLWRKRCLLSPNLSSRQGCSLVHFPPSHFPPSLSSAFSADVLAGFISTVPILSSLTFIQFPFRILWIPFPVSSSSHHHLGSSLHSSFQLPTSRDPIPFSSKNLLLNLSHPRGYSGEDIPNHLFFLLLLVSPLPLLFPINLLFISFNLPR